MSSVTHQQQAQLRRQSHRAHTTTAAALQWPEPLVCVWWTEGQYFESRLHKPGRTESSYSLANKYAEQNKLLSALSSQKKKKKQVWQGRAVQVYEIDGTNKRLFNIAGSHSCKTGKKNHISFVLVHQKCKYLEHTCSITVFSHHWGPMRVIAAMILAWRTPRAQSCRL